MAFGPLIVLAENPMRALDGQKAPRSEAKLIVGPFQGCVEIVGKRCRLGKVFTCLVQSPQRRCVRLFQGPQFATILSLRALKCLKVLERRGIRFLQPMYQVILVFCLLPLLGGVLFQCIQGRVDLVPLVLPALHTSAKLCLPRCHILEMPLQVGGVHIVLIKTGTCLLEKKAVFMDFLCELRQIRPGCVLT
eukprot:CAMPEP_0172741232 /NCGR_PEP_ID=MMETSP1074-20121228/126682_2 /TAXON_ID=2916 /ORGANISM="Ceratium fusus, Strain PA161109" /LENGTH=190 /DNA_ID=CAMNT_0013571493 /DNA_START=370 /DNA_END=942 /DNA_ORIENTATION=-